MLLFLEYILVIGESPTQGLDDTTTTSEAKYCITFRRSRRKFCIIMAA